MVKMQNVIPPGWVLPAGGSRLIPATMETGDRFVGSPSAVTLIDDEQGNAVLVHSGLAGLRRLAAIRGDAFKEVWVALAMIGVHYCGLQPWRLPNAEVLAAMPANGDLEG